MKIAFIGQKGIPVSFGGVEYHVDRLSRWLVKLGYSVDVYVRRWYTNKEIKFYDGVRLIHLPSLRTKHLDASTHSLFCSLHATLRNYDLIHYHAIGPSLFCFLPWLSGKKIVVTVHRLDWKTEKWGKMAKLFLKLGEYVSIKIPHRTIVVSKELKNFFLEKYGKETVLIPNGIDCPTIRNTNLINKKYGLKEGKYILFMGRLVPEKRVDWLMKAYQSLKNQDKEFEEIKLVIAGGPSGSGDYLKKLKRISRQDPSIIYTGFVSGKEKEELLSNALIFVLPSYLEGFPIALLEAKSYGLCCLVSDISPHREVVHDGIDGALFEAYNFLSLVHRLKELLINPQRVKEMGKKGKEEMKNRLDWDDVARKTHQVYQGII